MPDEVKDVQPEANADQVAPSQDIDLDSAALEAERRLAGEVPAETVVEKVETTEEVKEPVVEEKVEPVATPDEPPEEPTDHKERTKLGRKVAELEHNIGMLLEQNKTLIERLVSPQTKEQPQPEPEPEYLDLSTPEGLDAFLSRREQARVLAAQKDKVTYGLGYESQVKEWVGKASATEDPDVTEIHKLITGDTPFNVRLSSDPKNDFAINLAKAEAHYYKQKAKTPVAEKKSPLKNDPPRAPLAVGGESKADTSISNPKPLTISPAAMEFAKSQGWGDEEVTKILSMPVPNSFVKGRR